MLAVLLGASIYSYVVNIHDPNKNLFSQVWRGIKQERYTLFSGSPGGFYIEIGKALQENTGGDATLAVVNEESTGGLANAVNVMTTPNSFGLVQEDSLPEKDFIRDHIRYVTPLYLERLHIIYNHAEYKKVRERWLKKNPDEQPPPDFPSLGPAVHPAVKEFFRQAKVSTGPAGSGSRIFAGYLLESCAIGPISDHGLAFAPAMELLTEHKGMDIVFNIAGAPLNLVEQALALDKEDTKLKLMSIGSALVPALNQRYGIKLRGSSFKGKYDGYDNTPTIGSYAFLIASKDVANSATMEFLKVLDQSKNKIKQDLRLSAGKQFQLDEFPFYESFKQQHQSFLMELLRNLLVFLVSVSVTTAAVLMFLSWVVSGFKNVGYFRKLTKIYTDYLPENTNLDEGSGAFPKPVIYHNQTGIISKLIVGLKELLVLSSRIRQEYDTGGMTMSHYQHLQVGVANLKETFQRNLAQRFNEYLSSNEIGPATLRHYYTAGYLRIEDLGVLQASYADRVRSERKFPEEPSERKNLPSGN